MYNLQTDIEMNYDCKGKMPRKNTFVILEIENENKFNIIYYFVVFRSYQENRGYVTKDDRYISSWE